MKRHEFFSTLGISAGMIYLAPVLSSCTKESTDTTTPPGGGTSGAVDFTLDLTSATYASLNTNGGSIVKDNIIIAKSSAGVFVALSSICTHQGSTIGFENAASRFHCPNHGSNFGLDGSVLNGPATSALKKYNTALTGTSLRIFA
jgi:cytochrome b6-f complex iron-sulfur subunit